MEGYIECVWKYISNYERASDVVEGRGLEGTVGYQGRCYDCPGYDDYCGAYHPNEDKKWERK